MKSKYFVCHPLPKEYLDTLTSRDALELTIVGKDPYPTDPIGVPFCKPDWETMSNRETSGSYVLTSLGLAMAELRACGVTPQELFKHLAAQHGVAFLNLSYHYLGGKVRKGEHHEVLSAAHQVNLPLLKKSHRVILCGEAKRIKWSGDRLEGWIEAVHPDIRCKISRNEEVRAGWREYWEVNALARKFDIRVSVPDAT